MPSGADQIKGAITLPASSFLARDHRYYLGTVADAPHHYFQLTVPVGIAIPITIGLRRVAGTVGSTSVFPPSRGVAAIPARPHFSARSAAAPHRRALLMRASGAAPFTFGGGGGIPHHGIARSITDRTARTAWRLRARSRRS